MSEGNLELRDNKVLEGKTIDYKQGLPVKREGDTGGEDGEGYGLRPMIRPFTSGIVFAHASQHLIVNALVNLKPPCF